MYYILNNCCTLREIMVVTCGEYNFKQEFFSDDILAELYQLNIVFTIKFWLS